MTSTLHVGDTFPEKVTFTYIPYTPEKDEINACGIPVKYDASKEFKDKKVVLVAVPGAFTPTCQEMHIPTYLEKQGLLKEKGVDAIVVIAFNDCFVMSAWGKANNVKSDFLLFMADDDLKFCKSVGLDNGPRAKRFAMIIDHGKVVYLEKDETRGVVAGSGADAVLAKL